MPQFVEMSEEIPFLEQMEKPAGSVVLVNKFTIDPADEAQLLKAWADDADYMKKQPGFISTQLHRGVGERGLYLNYAIWETMEAFKMAFHSPEFKSRMGAYPASAVASPHLFEKLAVAGICLGPESHAQ